LDSGQRLVVDHRGGVLRVLAGPGTGKTTTLIESVVERVERRAVPIENILLLTFSSLGAGELRDRVTARLQRTISQPVARTFHSYAFGLLRQAAVLRGDPQPRLLSGSERDVTLRELLAGRLEDGADKWPADLAVAVRTRAFVDELSDLLMRAVERDVQPETLRALGRKNRRPDWVAASGVLADYLEVTSLKAPGAFDAAELIQRANHELRQNPNLLKAERKQRRRIFVDEYQDTDPAQTALLRLVATGADELILIGDPDQSIYSFRGSDHYAMSSTDQDFGTGQDFGTDRNFRASSRRGNRSIDVVPTVSLTVCRRSGSDLVDATRRLARRLSGPVQHRELSAADGLPVGSMSVALFGSSSAEASFLAATLRRAHFEDHVPWSEMAVLVRSASSAVDSLRRGLASAGVPVAQAVRGALTDEALIGQLLGLLRCVTRPDLVSAELAESLLASSIGGADPLQITRMHRYLRRLPDGPASMAELLTEPGVIGFLPPALRRSAERVRAVIAAGQQSMATGGSAEQVLWVVWQATGLSDRLERRSLAGGPDGSRADRDLESVLAIFIEAGKVSERAPGGGVDQLHEWVSQLQIADASILGVRSSSEAVAVLTAHASKGLEWDVVCLPGVQEGLWPNLRQRGSLLGADVLVDLLADRPAATSGLVAARLSEERRLFYVAATRARRSLLVTALDTEDAQPSRFLDELDPLETKRPIAAAKRRFVLPGLVAELRAVVIDEAVDATDREAAAHELARLAAAGVRGAHPDDWWGLNELSSASPIRNADAGPVPIRPSKFEAYLDCELKALMTELGAADSSDEVAASIGSLVHSVAELAPEGTTAAELMARLEPGWARLEFSAPWQSVSELVRARRMLTRLAGWLLESRTNLTFVAAEESFRVEVGDAVLSGTVDRLERDADDRLVIIDLKTGKVKPAVKDVLAHAQLAAYQFAVSEGGFDSGTKVEPGGARLVQLGTSGKTEQVQSPMNEFDDPDWVRTELARIATVLRGNTVTARVGKGCKNCPVKTSCPVHEAGRQVTK
jgi:superfamily I DNA/RNA helicase/RecB family exonuclease